jgi:hypothetical protein
MPVSVTSCDGEDGGVDSRACDEPRCGGWGIGLSPSQERAHQAAEAQEGSQSPMASSARGERYRVSHHSGAGEHQGAKHEGVTLRAVDARGARDRRALADGICARRCRHRQSRQSDRRSTASAQMRGPHQTSPSPPLGLTVRKRKHKKCWEHGSAENPDDDEHAGGGAAGWENTDSATRQWFLVCC